MPHKAVAARLARVMPLFESEAGKSFSNSAPKVESCRRGSKTSHGNEMPCVASGKNQSFLVERARTERNPEFSSSLRPPWRSAGSHEAGGQPHPADTTLAHFLQYKSLIVSTSFGPKRWKAMGCRSMSIFRAQPNNEQRSTSAPASEIRKWQAGGEVSKDLTLIFRHSERHLLC